MPSAERYAKEKEKHDSWSKEWKVKNREKWNEYQRQRYLAKVGKLKNVLGRSEEERKQRAVDKTLSRATRAKQARAKWDSDFTEFVTKEAHHLRRLRNKVTGFDWHVDHIVPLKGKEVSGLHVWYNLQVIPKLLNLRKGNKNSLHEERSPRLQARVREVSLQTRTDQEPR